MIGARLAGEGWRDAMAVGALMNARGMMELIVIKVGLDVGIIDHRMFTLLLLMALVTTMATSPALSVLLGRGASRGATETVAHHRSQASAEQTTPQ